MKLRRLLCAGAVLVAGCAGLTREEAPTPLASKTIALVTDACVIRDEVGDDLILRKAARELSQALRGAAEAELARRGFAVGASAAPFLCGTPMGEQKTFAIAEVKGDDEAQVTIPLLADVSLERRPELTAAYERLLAVVAAAPQNGDKAPARDPATQVPELLPADAQLLREALGTPLVWVASARGAQVSFGKAFGTGMLTAAPALLMGAAVVTYWMPVHGIRYESAVVDLERPAVQWKKFDQLRIEPASIEAVEAKWVAPPFQEVIAPAGAAETIVAAPDVVPSSEAAPSVTTAALPALLTLRARPAADAEVVVEVPRDSALERGTVLQTQDGAWRFVRSGGKPGWVRAEHVPDAPAQGASGASAAQANQP